MQKQIQEAVAAIQQKTGYTPLYGIILGTGLGQLVNRVKIEISIPYDQIPHFSVSTVESHNGHLIFGELGGKPVVVMQGRFHYYEGYNMQQITLPVRVMKQLGVRKLFISNAAGGLDPEFRLADLMLITDHINLLPENPLRGPNLDDFGPRFSDMFRPYDEQLLQQASSLAEKLDISLRKGIYVSVTGPNLETPAEYRFLRTIGADAVGMSTVPEVLVARHMNLPVFAVSVITDLCSPDALEPVTIQKVLAAAAMAEPKLTDLVEHMISLQTNSL